MESSDCGLPWPAPAAAHVSLSPLSPYACLPACPLLPACLCRFVELENTGVMREHLQSTMYISGTSDKGYTDRRGYRRSR